MTTETREEAIERANQEIVEQMKAQHDREHPEEPVLADPEAEAHRKKLPTYEEAQRGGVTSIRTFIREENNKLVQQIDDRIARALAESNRELKREIAELKKLLS